MISSNGGLAGYLNITDTQPDDTDDYVPVPDPAVTYKYRRAVKVAVEVDSELMFRRLDLTYAAPGSPGYTLLPNCPAGYGNSISLGSGSICAICTEGYYNTADNNNACSKCTNAPSHSYYNEQGETTSQCEYLCTAGYSTTNCYSPFENFLFNTLGVVGISTISIAFFLLILAPLFYYRLKKTYGWFQYSQYNNNNKKKTQNKGVLGTTFFDFGFGQHEFGSAFRGKHKSKSVYDKERVDNLTVNPMALEANSTNNLHIQDINAVKEYQTSTDTRSFSMQLDHHNKFNVGHTMKDLRLFHRLQDHNMPSHACRIYFLGANHPIKTRGARCFSLFWHQCWMFCWLLIVGIRCTDH